MKNKNILQVATVLMIGSLTTLYFNGSWVGDTDFEGGSHDLAPVEGDLETEEVDTSVVSTFDSVSESGHGEDDLTQQEIDSETFHHLHNQLYSSLEVEVEKYEEDEEDLDNVAMEPTNSGYRLEYSDTGEKVNYYLLAS